jgi:hypothetical protein
MRPSVIPEALNGQPFRIADARALGVSSKTLQGARFRRVARGLYVAMASDSPRLRVRGVMLALPPGTIATGVTGLQLLGSDVGPPLPMTFATTHPRQVRRRDVKVMRIKELPAHRDGVAAPEHCWLVAASTLNLLDLVTAGDSLVRRRGTTLARLQSAVQGYSGRGIRLARTAVRWYGSAWTHRARPGCDCVWFSPGCRCRNATSSLATIEDRSVASTWSTSNTG